MNRKDLDALNELYLSVYSEEQLNEAPLTPEQIKYKNERAQLGVISKGGKFVATGKVDPKLTSDWEWMTSSGAGRRQQLRAQKLAADLNKGQREARISKAQDATIAAADKEEKLAAQRKQQRQETGGGSGGGGGGGAPPRPAPPKPSGPVLSKLNGVEGTGVGANFKARAFTDAEKSRYASVAAKNAARSSASSGASKPSPTTSAASAPTPAIGKLGNTSFERRTPTSAELRAAQKERAGGASPEKALQAAKLAGQTQKSNDILASGKVAALGNKSTVQGTQQQVKADNIVKSGAVAALKPAAPTPSPTPARNGFGASTAGANAAASVSSATAPALPGQNSINNKKPTTPVTQANSYEWPSAKTIREIAGAYSSIYEAKKKVDQDEDGDNDFGDVIIARMIASGMSRAEAIAAVKNKEYNEDFELWVNDLLDEGYDLSDYTWDEMAEIYLDEATAMAKRGYDETEIRNKIAKSTGGGTFADKATELENRPTFGNKSKQASRERLARTQRGNFRRTNSSDYGLRLGAHKSDDPTVKALQAARGKQRSPLTPREKKQLNREAYEAYEFVASYLLENNFASTVDDANVIINNMSEGWFESIMEDVGGSQYTPNPIGNAIKAGAGLAKKVLSNPTVSSTINQTLKGNNSSGGYSTKPGDGKPYKDGPLWDGGGPKTSPKPQTKKQPPMRDEPLW